jgi:hypothetical protein
MELSLASMTDCSFCSATVFDNLLISIKLIRRGRKEAAETYVNEKR